MAKFFRHFFLAVGVCTAASAAMAAPLMEEHFDYTAGNLTGGTNGWSLYSGSLNLIQVNSPGLTFTDLNGVAGNKITVQNGSGSREDAKRAFTTATLAAGESFYLSYIMNVEAITIPNSGSGDYPIMFIETGSTSNFASRMYIRQGAAASTWQCAVRYGTGDLVTSSSELALGTPVFIVQSIDSVAGADNDTCRFWVNPPLGLATPPAPTGSTSASVDAPERQIAEAYGEIGLRQSTTNTTTVHIDEIRVSKSWADVTPIVPNAAVYDWALY